MRRALLIAAVFVALLPLTRADLLQTKAGTVLIGKVTSVVDGAVHFQTDDAGTIEVAIADIDSLESDQVLNLALPAGQTAIGRLAVTDGRPQLLTNQPARDLTAAELTRGWPLGDPDPRVAELWNYEAGAHLTGKTGTSERLGYGGYLRAVRATDEDKLTLYLRGEYAEDNGAKSADETVGGADYEWEFAPRHSVYARTELERDDIETVDLRTTVAAGYGYYFIDRGDSQQLRGRLGALYRNENFQTDPTRDTWGAEAGLYHMYRFNDHLRMTNELIYNPSVEDGDDYRIYHESKFDMPLSGANWKLQLGVSNEYNNLPATGAERSDMTYFGRIVYTWQ